MPNEMFHTYMFMYHLDQSISVLRVVWWYFHFYSIFNSAFSKQKSGYPDKTRRSVAFDLGLHSTPMSHGLK